MESNESAEIAKAAGEAAKATAKLAEVARAGLGAVAGPWMLKRQANALVEAKLILEQGGLTIANAELGDTFRANVEASVNYQNARRLVNIGEIVQHAQDALPPHVDDNPVDPDWTTRFFEYAKDVSSEDMQKLWGKLLSGEVARPGTFSLRAMEQVRNMTAAEAQDFTILCSLALSGFALDPRALRIPRLPGSSALEVEGFDVKRIQRIYDDHGLEQSRIDHFNDIGLLERESGMAMHVEAKEGEDFITLYGSRRAFLLRPRNGARAVILPAQRFTTVARELLKAVASPRSERFEQELIAGLDEMGVDAVIREYAPRS